MNHDSPIHPVPSGLKAYAFHSHNGAVLFLKYADRATNKAGYWLAGRHYRVKQPPKPKPKPKPKVELRLPGYWLVNGKPLNFKGPYDSRTAAGQEQQPGEAVLSSGNLHAELQYLEDERNNRRR